MYALLARHIAEIPPDANKALPLCSITLLLKMDRNVSHWTSSVFPISKIPLYALPACLFANILNNKITMDRPDKSKRTCFKGSVARGQGLLGVEEDLSNGTCLHSKKERKKMNFLN